MATPPRPSTAEALERHATDLHSLVLDFLEPARSHGVADWRIAEAERIADGIRAAVRGGA